MFKKVLVLLVTLMFSFSLIACGNSKSTTKIKNNTKQEVNQKNKNDKEEINITEGIVFDKINKVSNLAKLKEIKNKKTGDTNLNIVLKVQQGSPVEELQNFMEQIAKIQTNLKQEYLEKNYKNIAYGFEIEGNFKSTMVFYQKQGNNYKLTKTLIIGEEYEKAAKEMK